MKSFFTIVSILIFLLVMGNDAIAQQLLRKSISIQSTNAALKSVFNQMETKGKFYFSYNSNIIDDRKKVTINVSNKSISEILNTLLGSGFKYQVSGNHIIIKSAYESEMEISGRLVELGTDNPIEYASIYEKSGYESTMSDSNGNFKLILRQAQPQYEIIISRLSFEDTSLFVNNNFKLVAPISLKRNTSELDTVSIVPIQEHWLAKRILNTKTKINSVNLNNFFLKQPYQFSVLPGLSSKNRLKSQTLNKFSFNLLGGYTAGVRGFELGLGFNIVQHDMRYAQLSLVFNMVGGSATGAQITGLYNHAALGYKGGQISAGCNSTNGNANGIQLTGLLNRAKNLKGIQLSGASNWCLNEMNGVQLTGGINNSKNGKGFQASGVLNRNKNSFKGIQAVGILNLNDSLSGFQVAGFGNMNRKKTSGTQFAGVANITGGTVNGIQIAGIFNYAKQVNGSQLGLINIADSVNGWNLGLINIILKGKHSIDFSTNELNTFSISYKSGTNKMYNIFQAGGNPFEGSKSLHIGYGLGSEILIKKRWAFVQEAIASTIHAGNWNDQNIAIRYQPMVQFSITSLMRIYAGPTFNILYHEKSKTYEGFAVPFETKYPSFELNNKWKCWLGWTFGISIL